MAQIAGSDRAVVYQEVKKDVTGVISRYKCANIARPNITRGHKLLPLPHLHQILANS